MSWQLKAPTAELTRLTAAHEKAWKEIEARADINSLDLQAEQDRLGYILVELWEAHAGDEDLISLAIDRFDAHKALEPEPPKN